MSHPLGDDLHDEGRRHDGVGVGFGRREFGDHAVGPAFSDDAGLCEIAGRDWE